MLYDIDYSSPYYDSLNFQLFYDVENYPSITTEVMIALFIEHKQEIEEA
ncbi:hypothetical protein [Candidatus Anaplasma sp. TIGMIC]|nr:hypothetical protein [Candidatus Anaplasma sp. TIGMIC]MDB1135681.1 hypothetical protein [Candidatus Anaplasma sp. TIGMIC]